MEQGLGNGSNAACVCLDSSWGEFSAPSHLGFFFLLLKEPEPNRYSRGSGAGFGGQRARQQTVTDGERASLELHDLSRDLAWRTHILLKLLSPSGHSYSEYLPL